MLLVDARSAGEGQIVAEVRSLNSGVPSDLVPTSTKKIYLLSFQPKEGGDHTVTVTFNEEPVPRMSIKLYFSMSDSKVSNKYFWGSVR